MTLTPRPVPILPFLSMKFTVLFFSLLVCCAADSQASQHLQPEPVPSVSNGRPGSILSSGDETIPQDSPALASAALALEQGFPQVAEQKARALLSGTIAPGLKTAAILKLAESLIEQRQGEEALKELEYPSMPDISAVRLLRARVLVSLGKWKDALPVFESCAASLQTGESAVALLGKAECLEAMGKSSEALLVLQSIKNPTLFIRLRIVELAVAAGDLKTARFALEREKAALVARGQDQKSETQSRKGQTRDTRILKYLESRILLAEGKAEQAAEGFEQIIREPKGIPEGVYASATLGLTESRIITGGLETADNVLEDFIGHHYASAYLELMFRRLDQIYSQEENASDSELEKWVEKPPQRRASLAMYYFACLEMREGKGDRALKKFQRFTQENPDHPLLAQAYFNMGKLLSIDSKLDAALNAFESAMRLSSDNEFLAEVEMAAGIAEFQKNDFVLASNRFHSAAGHSPLLWEQATFNSALCWINQGNFDKFLEDYKEISRRFPESKFRPEMLLEEGLLQARTGDSKAKESLRLFLKDFPSHSRAVEAQLALAELAFGDGDANSSSLYLKAVLESPAPIQTAEQAALLEIFQADTPIKTDKAGIARVIELCKKFLKSRPESNLTDQVRMKLGQVYFRDEDYPNAQTQLENLANEHPSSALREPALFLAGQSSMRSMNVDGAIEIFQRVAELKGSLQLYARQQQAIAYSRLGKEKEAIILYDEILSANPPADLRFAVLAGKGDSLVTLYVALPVAGKDPKLLSQAISVFDQLAGQPDVTASWRNQALYKKAKCLETLSRQNEALAVFYDILQAPSMPGSEGPDYTWYYKAGFDAARILKTQEQWKSAIAVYEKLANLLGPHSDEAKKQVDQLRLEHFIWEE